MAFLNRNQLQAAANGMRRPSSLPSTAGGVRSARPTLPRCASTNTSSSSHPRSSRRHRVHTAIAEGSAAATELEQQAAAAAGSYDPDALSNFLGWLVSNGVEGLGTAQSKLSMYEGESGERGFLNTQPITAGEVLLRVPLRLALTSFEGDEENALLYEGAPWSVRLSAKLLREVSKGPQSSRWPYIQVLPKQVPSPLETFSWESMQQIQYPVGQAKLFQYQWLVADSYPRCSSEALGGASEEQFQWAMSIIHSRTFGNASEAGGVGVHMLVPLVDMFNHGGDETDSGLLSAQQRFPTDNVRWDVVQAGEVWEMVVTATQDVEEPGSQLLLSYGERCSDDFFIHYGFVPAGNPHESVQLFEDLTDALDWHHQVYPGQVAAEDAERLYRSALAEAQEQQSQQQQQQEQQRRRTQAAQLGTPPVAGADAAAPSGLPVLLHAGGQVDSALMLALGRVSGLDSHSAAAEPEVSRHCLLALRARCLELLGRMGSTLLQDMAALWADATVKGDEDTALKQLDLMAHYRQELHRQSLLPPISSSEGPTSSGSDLPIEAFAWQTYLSTPTPRSSPTADGAAEEPADSGSSSSGATALGQLSPSQQLLQRYHVNKKMVLWDAVLASGVALAAAKLTQETSNRSA